jgi:ParB family chromosome partitioning protein
MRHFGQADETDKEKNRRYEEIKIELLDDYPGRKFNQYDEQRLENLAESIRTSGVIIPIVVRSKSGRYEILSGHNRKNAAKKEKLETVPGVIYTDLDDVDAELIVTESNLYQRSFKDLNASERVLIINTHYNNIKKKSGYRSDLFTAGEDPTSNGSEVGATSDKLGKIYGMSGVSIDRYLRVYKLIDKLKERFYKGMICFRAAVDLSHLTENEQKLIENEILAKKEKVSMYQADELKKQSEQRQKSKQGELSLPDIENILKQDYSPLNKNPIEFKSEFLTTYFAENEISEELEKVLESALKEFSANKTEKPKSIKEMVKAFKGEL